jgi:hypothetical protein
VTIVRTWSVRPKAGRFDDAIGLLSEGAKLLDRHGAREIRLTHGGVAGNHTGALVVSCEFETFTRHGEFFEELGMDVENQSFMHRAREAEAPFTLESTLLLAEVPLDRGAGGVRGKVLETFLTRVRPGRMDDALRLAATAFELTGRFGASRCRLFELSAAGEMTGTHISVTEYEDMRAYGRVADAWVTDSDAQKLVKDVRSDKAPIDLLSSGVYTEIPILS